MTDLTLNEYEGVPEKELRRLLKEKASKIEGADSPVNYFEDNPTAIKGHVHFHSLTGLLKKIAEQRTKAIRLKLRPFMQNST